MKPNKKKKVGSEKLSRSQTVTVRLDPKIKYLSELGARKQHRTLSSFLETAAKEYLDNLVLSPGGRNEHDDPATVGNMAEELWRIDESERFLRLATRFPALLNYEEDEIWQMLRDSLLLSPAHPRRHVTGEWDWQVLEDYIFPALREEWPNLVKAHAEGVASADANQWIEKTRTRVLKGQVYPKHIFDAGKVSKVKNG